MFLKLPFLQNYIKHHKGSYHSHIITFHFTLSQVFKVLQTFSFSLSLSQLQIKTKTLFPSSSISLQWINKKQMLFSFLSNTSKKIVEQKVKLLKGQVQKFRLLKWLQG